MAPSHQSSWSATAPLVMMAGLYCGLAVGLGAFGAHGLRGRLTPEDLEIFRTGVLYQFLQGLALLTVSTLTLVLSRFSDHLMAHSGSAPHTHGGSWAELSGVLRLWIFACRIWTVAIPLFSGSLYLLVLVGPRSWGAVTPLGGVLFLAGWGVFLLGCRKLCQSETHHIV